jgi:cytidylate kinase
VSQLAEAVAHFRRLDEGIFDPYVLKAIFLAGGMGSGKSWVSKQLFGAAKNAVTGLGLKHMNADEVFRIRLKPTGIPLKTALKTPQGRSVRAKALQVSDVKLNAIQGQRLGVVIDGTGQHAEWLLNEKSKLEKLGYDCSMVMVVTSLEVALKRNRERSRTAPDEVVAKTHENLQKVRAQYRAAFGKNYYEVENSTPFDARAPKTAKRFHKLALKILRKPLKNPKGLAWLNAEAAGLPPHMMKKVTWLGKKAGA